MMPAAGSVHLSFLLSVLPQQLGDMRRLIRSNSQTDGASAWLDTGVQVKPWKLRSGGRCTAGHSPLLCRRAGS